MVCVCVAPAGYIDSFVLQQFEEGMEMPHDVDVLMHRPIQEGDMMLFIGVSECVVDVHGLKCVPESEFSLEGLAFFELHLSKDSFPEEGMSLRAFEREFNCAVRFLNRAGHT